MQQRDCLVSNERSCGTYKTRVNGDLQRFFALSLTKLDGNLKNWRGLSMRTDTVFPISQCSPCGDGGVGVER